MGSGRPQAKYGVESDGAKDMYVTGVSQRDHDSCVRREKEGKRFVESTGIIRMEQG